MLGFLGDVGALAKLVQGNAGVRPRDDLEAAITKTMQDIADHLESLDADQPLD